MTKFSNKLKNKKLKFVDAKKYGFVVEPKYYFYGWTDSAVILMRESVARQLRRAKKFLPKGYNFKIWDCKRTYKTQSLMLKSFRRRLKLMYPRISSKNLNKKLYTYGGRLMKCVKGLGTHRNAGALDLTIIDKNGEEFDMGTEHDNLTKKAGLDYYENIKHLTKEEKRIKNNRRLLKRVMAKAGLVSYREEWWHYSYEK